MKARTLHARACRLLGTDQTKTRLVGPVQFKRLTGRGIGRNFGLASWDHNVIYVSRRAGYDTHVHELLHLLFPWRPHWWVYGAAFKLTGLNHGTKLSDWGRNTPGYRGSVGRVKETKPHILKLARRSAQKRGLA